MAKLNVMQTIEQARCEVNPCYDLIVDAMNELYEKNSKRRRNCDKLYYMMLDSFYFGYAQGRKAARAEMKKALAKE